MNKSTAAKGAAWMMLFSLVSKIMFPIVGIVITGRVGVEAVGMFGIVIALYTVTELFRDGGLAVTFIADAKNEHGSDGLYHGLGITLGWLFAVLTVATSGAIARFYDSPEMTSALWWTAASMVIGSMASIPGGRFTKQARFREAGLIDVAAAGFGYAVALVMALMGYGLMALLVQMVLRALLYFALVVRYAGWIKPVFDLRGFAALFRVTVANLGANVAYTVYTMADYAVIGKALGQAANGAYWVSFNIATKPMDLITWPISRTMFVAFSREKDNPARQAHLLSRTLAAVALFSIPTYVLIGVHAQTIIDLLYPKGFGAAGPSLAILSIYLGFRTLGASAGSALVASGRASLHALSWLPGYAIAIAGIASVWTRGTLTDFVTFLTLGAVVVYCFNVGLAWRHLPPSKSDWVLMGRSVASVVPAVLVLVASRWLPLPGWAQLAVGGMVAVLVHVLVLAQTRLGDWRRAFRKSGAREIYQTL